MGRFVERQVYDRTPGPSPHAAGDGIDQGATYYALVNAPAASGLVPVVIPSLSSEHYYTAICSLTVTVGGAVLVIFDDRKIPWVVATA